MLLKNATSKLLTEGGGGGGGAGVFSGRTEVPSLMLVRFKGDECCLCW